MKGPGDEGGENLYKHCLLCSFTPEPITAAGGEVSPSLTF